MLIVFVIFYGTKVLDAVMIKTNVTSTSLSRSFDPEIPASIEITTEIAGGYSLPKRQGNQTVYTTRFFICGPFYPRRNYMNGTQMDADTDKDLIAWEPFHFRLAWIVRLSGLVSYISYSNVGDFGFNWTYDNNGVFWALTPTSRFPFNKYQRAELMDIHSNGLIFKFYLSFNTLTY